MEGMRIRDLGALYVQAFRPHISSRPVIDSPTGRPYTPPEHSTRKLFRASRWWRWMWRICYRCWNRSTARSASF